MADAQPIFVQLKAVISPRDPFSQVTEQTTRLLPAYSRLGTSPTKVQLSPPPKPCSPPRHRAACGHGLQGRPGTRTCSVPELVEQVSLGRGTKAEGGALGLGLAGPPGALPGQPTDIHSGEAPPSGQGGQGGSGKDIPDNMQSPSPSGNIFGEPLSPPPR